MKDFIVNFLKEDDGVTAIEYGLIAGLISVLIVVAITGLGTNLQTLFVSICGSIKSAAGASATGTCAAAA